MKITLQTIVILLLAYANSFGDYQIPDNITHYMLKNDLKYVSPEGYLNKEMVKYYRSIGISDPWSISADFNGDGVQDFAGLLVNSSGKLELVVFYSELNEMKHKILMKGVKTETDSFPIAVIIEPPGTIEGFPFEGIDPKDLVVELKHPCIHLIFFEMSAVLHYWQDGGFKYIWTAD